jgi:hypothetical protein
MFNVIYYCAFMCIICSMMFVRVVLYFQTTDFFQKEHIHMENTSIEVKIGERSFIYFIGYCARLVLPSSHLLCSFLGRILF